MADWVDREMTRAYERATKAGEARLANEPRAARKARFVIELTNGCNSDANLRVAELAAGILGSRTWMSESFMADHGTVGLSRRRSDALLDEFT